LRALPLAARRAHLRLAHVNVASRAVERGFADEALAEEIFLAAQLPTSVVEVGGRFADRLLGDRRLHFAQLAQSGGFAPLRTTVPPQSPVAWSTFITGLDPGRTAIFDFIHRDPKTMEPFLSTSRTESSGRNIRIGRWQFPLTAGRVELLRKGRPFWAVLDQRGVDTHRIVLRRTRRPLLFGHI